MTEDDERTSLVSIYADGEYVGQITLIPGFIPRKGDDIRLTEQALIVQRIVWAADTRDRFGAMLPSELECSRRPPQKRAKEHS